MIPRRIELLLSTLLILFLFVPISLSQNDPAGEWHLLYIKIRDRLISKEEAQERLKTLEAILREVYSKTGKSEKDDRLCFPLKGYSFHSIGGKGGSGYQAQGYDFFDGNDHTGHPGHDLFIRDKNQDGLDDMTEKPVGVLSVCSGIVVSINLNWAPSSPIRGGNYIWICEPIKNRYYYYAHLDEIFVRVGQMVSKGDRLGIVGRTGVKAYLRHSPTHLHFVAHQSMDGYPKPINPYIELLRGNQE